MHRRYALVAELVAANATDEEILAVVSGLLPENYRGNSLEELPEWIASARKKGFDQKSRNHDYDAGQIGPIPLGFTKDGNYALRDQIRNIILVLSANQLLNTQSLIGLAPSEFWAEQYPGSKSLFSSMLAGEALLRACRQLGAFDPGKVRGRGVWKEQGQVIANLGQPLPGDLTHQYLAFSRISVPETFEFDATGFRDLLRLLPFKDQNNADLLFGWACLAPLCGALEWRMHMFLYGPPNSGKTTLHNLVSQILNPMVVAADGQSTEAGIRQSLGPDALPVVLDEFETDSHQSRLQGIMRLARSASSSDSPLLRGTPEGKAIQFNIKTMMLFSAVNVTGMTPADQSRITVIELVPHDSNLEMGEKIAAEATRFSTLGPSWCGYVIRLAPKILESIPILKSAMVHYDSRVRQTMASLVGAMFVALEGRVPTAKEAVSLADQYKSTIKTHLVDQERDNGLECLNHLLAHPVRGNDGADFTLGHWIANELARIRQGEKDNYKSDSEQVLAMHQIKFHIKNEHSGFLIRNGATPIDRIFQGTKWADGSWSRALGQLSGAFKLPGPQRFADLPGKHRSVGLPLDYVPELDDGPADEGNF